VTTNAIDPTGALFELAQLGRDADDMMATLQQVVEFAQRRVPGAEEAAITLIRNAKAGTVASTGGLADVLDELQYETGYGPCLDAGRCNELMHIADSSVERRWPRYLPTAIAQGLGSSLSMPIPVEHYLVGALNLYARTPHAFSTESLALADALSLHICAMLSRVEKVFKHRTQAEQIEQALTSRAVIEQAKGIIMVQRKCDAAEAFNMLRELSMNQNVKLADLAAGLVSSASGHPVRFGPPGAGN